MTEKFYKLPQDLAARSDLLPSDKLVFAVIQDCFNGKNICWPGKQHIKKRTALADKTVCDSIERLRRAGVLIVERRGNGRSIHFRMPQQTSSENEPVQKPNRFREHEQTGSESEPEPVQKLNPNQTDYMNQTYSFVLQDKNRWCLPKEKLSEYSDTFRGIDVPAELRKAAQWLVDNQTKRKTPKGMPRFLSGWLGRCKPAPAASKPAAPESPNNSDEILRIAGLTPEQIEQLKQKGWVAG